MPFYLPIGKGIVIEESTLHDVARNIVRNEFRGWHPTFDQVWYEKTPMWFTDSACTKHLSLADTDDLTTQVLNLTSTHPYDRTRSNQHG